MMDVNDLTIKVYEDGAEIEKMRAASQQAFVKGFTTNPSLLKQAGVTDYLAFARQVVAEFPKQEFSFEVFSNEPQEMLREAQTLHDLGPRVYVKVLSIFVGRVADAGIDPHHLIESSVEITKSHPEASLLWASTREVYNVFEAQQMGVDIITVPPALITKLSKTGKAALEISVDTVKGFQRDIEESGLSIL